MGVFLVVVAMAAIARAELDLWFYFSSNLQVDENVSRLESIWRRASKAGYTHVLLTDSKFARLGELGEMETKYFGNIARVRKIADELKLQIVPALFSIGWANNTLWHNPNLAEGLPVKDTLFVVKDGLATVVADPPVVLGKPHWKDDTVWMTDNLATIDNADGNARFVYRFGLPPFRCYHISVWVKTDNFQGTPEIKVLAGNQMLQFQNLGVRQTQGWTQHHVVFNTLDNEHVGIYFGVWGGGKGKLRWRDWRIEEVGLVNVLRRPGAPLLVRRDDGQPCEEGRDYARVEDPKLGNEPWSGEYQSWHEPLKIRAKLPNGTRLRVSWYHPAIIYDGAVMCCLSEPETQDILQDEARRVRDAWKAPGYMMSHDEIRVMNWDASCQKRHLDAGEILADNVRMCTRLLEGAQVYVWSDMFDPSHNARKGYYLVRGDLGGSWVGVDRSVTIVNWNFGNRDKSLKFFSDRGHKQILAGYYDGAPEQIKQWLASAANIKGIVGVMYTTWQGKYDDLEAFAALCRQ
jgi:hypothetical protein